MWLTKMTADCLRVVTDSGPRYVQLSFAERLRAAWVFRNFAFLPQQVLSAREQRWFMEVCSEQRITRSGPTDDTQDQLIGTLITSELLPLRGPRGRHRPLIAQPSKEVV